MKLEYTKILEEELLPALGCTEPIAVAYAAALARRVLGKMPDRVEIFVSGNILKNVKSVIVPNTGGLKGVAAAAMAGAVAGDPCRKLEVLSSLTEEDRAHIAQCMKQVPVSVKKAPSRCVFDIGVKLFAVEDEAFVRIEGRHTNVVEVEKNGECAFSCAEIEEGGEGHELSVAQIAEYASTVPLEEIETVISRQIAYNSAICAEGMRGDYGARVGKILMDAYGNCVHNRAKATAAAGSDARMNGCCLPVVIVSGSGNQGITACMPVCVYAEQLKVPRDKLLRAVALADLITLHLKSGIGRLSAYCGAVSAGVGAGAGVCYLHGGDYEEIAHTVANALAIASGILCDGAKSSCAAKIASALDAVLLGFEMTRRGSVFSGGDGILEQNVEGTIGNVSDVAREGMRSTDEEIIRLMIKNLQ